VDPPRQPFSSSKAGLRCTTASALVFDFPVQGGQFRYFYDLACFVQDLLQFIFGFQGWEPFSQVVPQVQGLAYQLVLQIITVVNKGSVEHRIIDSEPVDLAKDSERYLQKKEVGRLGFLSCYVVPFIFQVVEHSLSLLGPDQDLHDVLSGVVEISATKQALYDMMVLGLLGLMGLPICAFCHVVASWTRFAAWAPRSVRGFASFLVRVLGLLLSVCRLLLVASCQYRILSGQHE
jgi:hypothetical protein